MRWRSSLFFLGIACLIVCTTVTAQAGLVNYWTFDSDGTDSVTGNSGTFNGVAAITNAAGEYASGTGALKIAHNTASGDYFDVAYEVFPEHSVYTVTGWYKWDTSFSSQAADQRAFIYETTPTYSSGVGVYTSGSTTTYMPTFWADGVSSDVLANVFASSQINDSAWHFFAVTYDTVNDEAAYYHDGMLTSWTSAPAIVATNGLHIGSHRAGDGTRNWQGYVDEFAVYEGIISESDIYSLYSGAVTPLTVAVDETNVPPPIPTGRPVAYWSFDSNYSSTVNNNLYQGTAHGGSYTSIDTTSGVAARGAGALKLNSGPSSGNETCVVVGEEVGMGVIDPEQHKQVSVSSWFQVEDFSGDSFDSRMMVYETATNYAVSLGVRPDANGTLYAQWFTQTDTATPGGAFGPEVEIGEWNHVVTNYDLETHRMQFYFNGSLLYDQPIEGNSFVDTDGFVIGNHRLANGERDFDGYIDDVAVYHGVMTPEAVAGLYSGTYTAMNVPITDGLSAFTRTATLGDASYSQVMTGDFTNPAGMSYSKADNSLVVVSRSYTAGEGGIYKIAGDGTTTLLVGDTDAVGIAATAVNPANGDLFFVADGAGVLKRVAAGTSTVETWASNFNNDAHLEGGLGDDDGCSMVIVPSSYTGGLVTPGSLLMVDRGAGGYEEIWSISTVVAETCSKLVSDSDMADGVGNILIDPTAIAMTNSQIFVSDLGTKKIYEVTATDTLVEFMEFPYEAPVISMVGDLSTGDLITLNALGEVFRIDTLTGDSELILALEERSGAWTSNEFNGLTISDDGKSLVVGSYATDTVYLFSLGASPQWTPGDANKDGKVDGSDVTILAGNWQKLTDATWDMGDFNGDGKVDGSDVTILAGNWQAGVGTSAASVPEPSVVVLLVSLALGVLWFKRR